MNRTKRFIFQILFWFALWLIAWLLLSGETDFISKNTLTFIFQIVVVALLVYFMAPAFLFKKKYVLFITLSIGLITLCSFISLETILDNSPELPSSVGPKHPQQHIDGGFHPRPPRNINAPGPNPPPKFLIQFLALSVAYVFASFLETFMFAQRKEQESILNKNENLKTELKLLKSQINPHFLFNALNNIYALSAINSEKTQESISTLSDMLRYVLYECEQELVTLEKEITYIQNYIKLFSLKSSKAYPITTDFNIANKNLRIAPMLLIPFMENALKHSNIEKIVDTFIQIKINADTSGIQFQIENSTPQNPVVTDSVGGIGLENVKKRLAILYPEKHELFINETSADFKVNLNIDLNEKDKMSNS